MSVERLKPLGTLALVLFGFAMFDVVLGAARTHAFIGMLESGDFEQAKVLIRMLQLGALVGLGLVAWLAAGVARRGGDALDRQLWWAVAIAAGLACADIAFAFFTELAGGEDPLYFRMYRHRWFRITVRIVHLGWIAMAAIAAARRVKRRPGLAVGAVLLCGASLALGLIDRPLGELSVAKSMWLQFAVFTGMPALAIAATGWLCREASSRPIAAPRETGEPQLAASPRWARAADGLRLYRSALVWRLVITFGGYVLLLLAGLGRSPGLARLMMWAMPLAALATGTLMLAGVVRFSKQPHDSPARSAAVFAAAALGLALLLDFVVLTHVLSAVSADTSGYEAYNKIRTSLESAQKVAPWGLALSFAGLIALMFSLRTLATRLGDGELAGRAAALVVWVVVIAAGVLGLRLWIAKLTASTAGMGLVFAFFVGIAALVVLIAYLGLVRAVEEKLRGAASGVEVPTATLLDD